MPALSVVTPAYNSARYLTYALESVAALSVSHEHIVIDGGSEDGTTSLLEHRADPHLTWVSEPDRGQTHAVNKGLERARGELIGWLNADDEYIAEGVDRAVGHLLAEPGLDAVFGGMHFMDADGTVRRRYHPARYSWHRWLYMGDYIQTPTIIFRRALLERVGLLDEAYVDSADYDFYLRVFHGARVERVSEALVRFRYHTESKTGRNVWLQQQEALQIRLKWARGRRDRAVMKGFDLLKRVVLPRISRWPKPY